MRTKTKHSKAPLQHTNQNSLKGTIFSVGVVGAVIFVTYLLIYGLYMARL